MTTRRAILGELDPISFDDLPLGGEWTTRRRTISESEVALFAALAGDFSPLTIDASGGQSRLAPPAMLVAVAVGLGTIDMPIPQVASWEWVNWKFPKPVRAGETIFARWTLTQKRPPVHGSRTGIAVWRVDVHTGDGAMCAEGEIGAAIFRRTTTPVERSDASVSPAATPVPAPRRRRKRRSATGTETAATPPAAPAATAPAAPAAPAADRAPRRRRRRRPSGGGSSTAAPNGEPAGQAPAPAPASSVEATPPAPQPALAASPQAGTVANPISRVMRRLRRT